MTGYMTVFVGGGIGVILRHGVNRAALSVMGAGFPYGTLFVNVPGGRGSLGTLANFPSPPSVDTTRAGHQIASISHKKTAHSAMLKRSPSSMPRPLKAIAS